MNSRYPEVAERARHRCEYCRAPEAAFNFSFEVDHILPASRGGTDALANLALACHACNLFKSAHQTGNDPQTLEESPLFNPRLDAWSTHFRAQPNGEIIGLTPTGTATIARLRMNSEAQIRARQQWVRLDLFP